MRQMKNLAIVIACIAVVIGVGVNARTQSAKADGAALVITSDMNRPYDVLNSIVHVKAAKVNALGFSGPTGAFNKAVVEGFKEISEAARKAGADAVIHVRVEALFQPLTSGRDQEVGQVIIYGTAVKYK